MSRVARIAHELVRQSAFDRQGISGSEDLDELRAQLKETYPGLDLLLYENSYKIEIQRIKVENKGQGIGTQVIKKLQEYASRVNKPIVVLPEWGLGKKEALLKFYRSLGFKRNTGRKVDYTLSYPGALTMYWKP